MAVIFLPWLPKHIYSSYLLTAVALSLKEFLRPTPYEKADEHSSVISADKREDRIGTTNIPKILREQDPHFPNPWKKHPGSVSCIVNLLRVLYAARNSVRHRDIHGAVILEQIRLFDSVLPLAALF